MAGSSRDLIAPRWTPAGRARKIVTVLAAGLALAPAAGAHGPAGGGAGYVSSVNGLQPPVIGAVATVLGGDDRLQLVNYSGKTIVVDGYEGEPFLRFTPNGVYENTRSPTTYLSRVRDPAATAVPASADAEATPRWRKATEGTTFAWHDRRIRWTGAEPPPVVESTPDEPHLIFRWQIPARADAKRFVVSGFLGYARPPSTASRGGTSPWLPAAVIGCSALAAVALGAGARRVKRQAP